MKRHPALVPLSHDHHHALVEARRLRRAADAADDPREARASFVAFFDTVTVPHFREEEEVVFPLVAASDEARPFVVQALIDQLQLHALVAELGRGGDPRATMRTLADLLEAHIRREERELFPLIERLALEEIEVVRAPASNGPVWGLASDDLNATLLAWAPGRGPAEHVNAGRDVLIFVVSGSATVDVDGTSGELRPGRALVIEKGRRRRILAGPHGVEYLSVHLRRPLLQIGKANPAT